MENFIKKLNYLTILFLVLLVPIFFFDKLIMYSFSINIIKFNFYNVLWTMIPILIFIYIYNIIKRKAKLDVFDYFIILIILLNVFVCLFSIDISTSIFGSDFRHEGFLSYISYYFIFLNCRNIDNKKQINTIFKVFVSIGIVQFIYCFIQMFFKSVLPSRLTTVFSSNMVSGFINNPNFLGSYIILLLGIVMILYLIKEKKNILYFFLTLIFFVNLIFTQSTGPFLAFVFMFIFSLIFLIVKKRFVLKRFLILLICLVLTYFLVDYSISRNCSINNIEKSYTINYDLKQLFRALTGKMKIYDWPSEEENAEENKIIVEIEESTQKKEKKQNNSFIFSEVPLKAEDNLNGLGSGRIIIWRNSFKLIPEYIWFGCGIDNFGKAYKWHNNNTYYDKAHNDFLQILITQGIFVFAFYVVFLVLIFVKGIKSNNIYIWALLLSFVGYCAQSFTNISVINVAPYFYMISGFLSSRKELE